MKATKILCILLALACFSACLVACNETPPSGDGGDLIDGNWEALDFKDQEVKIAICTTQHQEVKFPASSLYSRGPDESSANEVTKEVLARNKTAAELLNVKITYTESNYHIQYILEQVRQIVQSGSKNSPDIYINDIYGLSRAMVNGLLWNVKNPGENVKNYFDFSKPGYYTEYMKGCTFNQDKLYLIAGDYFIDMIRFAFVVYVNHDLFRRQIGQMPEWCESLEIFYEYVEEGIWDIDMLSELASRGYVDSGIAGLPEATDEILGLSIGKVAAWVISAGSEITVYYQDKNDGYKPKVMDTVDDYQKVADKWASLQTARGVLYAESLGFMDCFLAGNTLFTVGFLGEMESEAMRSFSMEKGLVPVPKWEDNEQEDYHSCVHDQAEVGCILNTAKAYSAASALLQYMNENSGAMVNVYYNKGLKYKYNDSKQARTMMDIVRNTMDAPFGYQIGVVSQTLYTGTTPLTGMFLYNNTTCASTFASEKDAYVDCLNRMLEQFNKMP